MLTNKKENLKLKLIRGTPIEEVSLLNTGEEMLLSGIQFHIVEEEMDN